jgi:hypothetical protein
MEASGRKPPLRRLTAQEDKERRHLEESRREVSEHWQASKAAVKQAAHESGDGGLYKPGFAYVGFRAPSGLKAQLEATAAANGRSLSSEVQFRLERSLRTESSLTEALLLLLGTTEGEVSAERIADLLKPLLDKLKLDGGTF